MLAMAEETATQLGAALSALRPEIRSMLAEDLPVDLERAKAACAAGAWESLREHVHRLKGSASFCHLTALRDVCATIEDSLKAGTPPGERPMGKLSAEIRRVLTALEQLP
jgi:HPt (histidine-containing phosphotransfer) domain-containing protein